MRNNQPELQGDLTVVMKAEPEPSQMQSKGDELPISSELTLRHLLVLKDTIGEREISLAATTYSLGRHKANSIVIDGNSISRHHALLLRIPDPQTGLFFFRIIDGNLQGKRSKNGLWVNGKRVYSQDLHHGDVIHFSANAQATYRHITEAVVDPKQTVGADITSLKSYTGPPRSKATSSERQQLGDMAMVRLSSIPEMNIHPIIEMDITGTITYLNPAAIARFPTITDEDCHPLRVGLMPWVCTEAQDYFSREVAVDDCVYEQTVQYIAECQLVRSYLVDITQRKQMEEILRKSEERYAVAARGANDGLWDWDLLNDTIYFSPRWKTMIGYADQELSSQKHEWFDRIHPDDIKRVKDDLDRHLKGHQSHFESEFRLRHKSGDYRWFRCRGMALLDDLGHPCRIAGSQTDITEYNLAREQLLHDAFYDSMTGLPNRVMLMDRITQAIKRCKRHQQQYCAVLFLDLDRFKVINDSLGHMLGDKLLVEVAKRLSVCIREPDTVARLGGDEFVVLVDELESIEGAIATAQRIKETLTQGVMLNGQEVFTSTSIGIALGNSHYERAEDLLRDADTAMYEAKQMGKDRYSIFSRNMHSQALNMLHLENDLRRAIERQEFQLHYQPIVDLRSNQICSFEALVRWQHPDRGLVPPSEFIPLAEDTGLIVPLGQLLLEVACTQLQAWQRQFPGPQRLAICVNIASRQFAQADFVAQLAGLLNRVAIAAGTLKLEITESVIMKQPTEVAKKLAQLRDLGVKLSIDDFGTGYSSLSYLQTFPVDTLKIDRSFVLRMGHPDSREIVKTIITLAHNLKLDVVAEGVETAIQAQLLKAMHCEFVQGYYFSRPVNAADATQLLQQSISQPAMSS